MSLSSLLLAKAKTTVDSELNALFNSKPPLPAFSKPATIIQSPGNKALGKRKAIDTDSPSLTKRTKTKTSGDDLPSPPKTQPKPDRKKKKVKAKAEISSDDEDNDSGLENAYLTPKTSAASADVTSEQDDGDSGEGEAIGILHESLVKKTKRRAPTSKQKFVPSDETPEMKNARTIFIGNLSLEVAQKKSTMKALHRHILSHVPTAKIESTRFRSIPFQAPTSKLVNGTEGTLPTTPTATTSKEARPHDRERTSSWRTQQEKDEDPKSDDKKFLTSSQKKKIAFINHEFHSTADTMHAYIVFAYPLPPDTRPANLPPLPTTLDPFAAAKAAAETCDGSTFMDRVIRVDFVGAKGGKAGNDIGGTDQEASAAITMLGDPKMTVFVGNLEFATKEEDLRVFFEGVVSAERGPPLVQAEREDEDGNTKPTTWVTRVRIIRDKDTQLGKGFAYVQFADRECVDEVLGMDQLKLKFAKRKLRVQRCKTLPGASSSIKLKTNAAAAGGAAPGTSRIPAPRAAPIVIPKGDPLLGERLAHLPKEERKQAKLSDADRVARRLAKKKARNAMGAKGDPAKAKERTRVRERVKRDGGKSDRKIAGSGGDKKGKGRVRSEKSLTKRNAKK